ncbi:TolC family protein [Granulicella tundricola]|nr:TolC family protein [Granulicella tundricola]
MMTAAAACGGALLAQATTVAIAPAVGGSAGTDPGMQAVGNSTATGQTITLTQALNLARANEPSFAAAYAASRVANLDKSIARSALLPSVVYHNQYLFTQSNHVPLSQNSAAGAQATTDQTAPVFIANNGVHEYVSQAVVNETIGLTQFNAVARADAASAIATAELEISRRGLAATVVGLFYGASIAQGKIAIARRALNEAQGFVEQTQQRAAAREVAHADVVKAQLTLQQRQREMADAELMAEKSRLDLGVLLFPDPRTLYEVELPTASNLPTRAETEAAAVSSNPELASAVATLRASNLDVTAARAAYLPDLAFNYSYGIDAAQFAVNGLDGARNLGYSASATLDIPVWDWFATAHKVKQAQIQRDSAKVALSATQRRLVANLEEFYNEARVAYQQLDSLQLSVDTARDSLRLTRLRYTNGEGTVLEVVDAQNSLTTAELAMQDGTVRYQLALANLQNLTGIL